MQDGRNVESTGRENLNTPANNVGPTAQGGEQEGLVLGDLIRLFIEQIWWIVGITVVVVVAALVYVEIATPIYSVDALVQVEQPDNTSSPLAQQANALSSLSGTTLPTAAEIQVIESRDVLGPVVHQFKMQFGVEPKTFPVLGSLAHLLGGKGHLSRPWFGLKGYAWGGESVDIDDITVPQQLENVPLLLTVGENDTYELRDPNGNLLLKGAVGQTAHGNGVTMLIKQLVANPGCRFTVTRQNELETIEGFGAGVAVAEQGKQTGVIQISMTGASPDRITALTNAVADSYLKQHIQRKQEDASLMLNFLNEELPGRKAELQAAEQRLSAFQQKSGTFKPSEEANVYLQGAIDYERQIDTLKLQEADLLQRYTREHPVVKSIEEQIAQITAARDKFQERFKSMPIDEANALSLQRDAKVSEDIYVLLLNRVQELQIQRAGTTGNVRILDRAMPPATPIKPKKGMIVAASVFLGIILGALFVFGRKQMSSGIEDPDVIERSMGLPVMGAVPLNAVQVRWDESYKRARDGRRAILAKSLPKDPSVESLRSFRTSLQFALADAPNNLLAMSGPVPGTGKSFVSVNIATLLAEAGKRVLLVDADMRRGHLNEYFNQPRFPGLSEALTGTLPVEQVVNQTDIAGLSTIWTGAIPDNPAELLMSPETRNVFETLSNAYDIVIIDTPPVLAVTDATIIGSFAGSSFLVFRHGMHAEREVSGSIKKLTQSGGRVVGAIFNAIPSRVAKYGKYGGGNYHYVYQYDSESH